MASELSHGMLLHPMHKTERREGQEGEGGVHVCTQSRLCLPHKFTLTASAEPQESEEEKEESRSGRLGEPTNVARSAACYTTS